jgi:hypothetical protein
VTRCTGATKGRNSDAIVLVLKFAYDLDGKKATLISMSDDISMLAYKRAVVIDSFSLAISCPSLFISIVLAYKNSKS